jgi:hypothetical protein
MAFTRFHDDPVRIQKQLAESTFLGRYQLDTPGQGVDLPFSEDPQLRLQKWGANMRTNGVNLESDLRGMTRKLNRDYITQNNYLDHDVRTERVNYRDSDPFIEESRATNPAWTYRDLEQTRWETPFLNPQANLEKKFHDNIQTRILEKDFFTPSSPSISTMTSSSHLEFYPTVASTSKYVPY